MPTELRRDGEYKAVLAGNRTHGVHPAVSQFTETPQKPTKCTICLSQVPYTETLKADLI